MLSCNENLLFNFIQCEAKKLLLISGYTCKELLQEIYGGMAVNRPNRNNGAMFSFGFLNKLLLSSQYR